RHGAIQHPPMRLGSRGVAIRARAGQRELQGAPLGHRVSLLRRQLAAERLLPLGLGLLELDVFAFESSCHCYVSFTQLPAPSPQPPEYSTEMLLDVTTKRSRLQQSLRLEPGPLGAALTTHLPTAERAAGGLFRRDPAAWSGDAAVQKKIADRLGWLSSPHA